MQWGDDPKIIWVALMESQRSLGEGGKDSEDVGNGREVRITGKGNVMPGAETGVIHFEEGRSHEPRNADQWQKMKAREQSPL